MSRSTFVACPTWLLRCSLDHDNSCVPNPNALPLELFCYRKWKFASTALLFSTSVLTIDVAPSFFAMSAHFRLSWFTVILFIDNEFHFIPVTIPSDKNSKLAGVPNMSSTMQLAQSRSRVYKGRMTRLSCLPSCQRGGCQLFLLLVQYLDGTSTNFCDYPVVFCPVIVSYPEECCVTLGRNRGGATAGHVKPKHMRDFTVFWQVIPSLCGDESTCISSGLHFVLGSMLVSVYGNTVTMHFACPSWLDGYTGSDGC